MRKLIVAIAAAAALALSVTVAPSVAAPVAVGAKCTVKGKYAMADNKTYQCVQAGNQLRWKLISKVTKPGAKCYLKNAVAVNAGWRRVQCIRYGSTYQIWVDKSFCPTVQAVERAGNANWVCGWRRVGNELERYWAKSKLGAKCEVAGELLGTTLNELPLACTGGTWHQAGTASAPWPRFVGSGNPPPGWQVDVIDGDVQFSTAVVSVTDNVTAEVCEQNGFNEGCTGGWPRYPDPANTFRYIKVAMVVHNWSDTSQSPYWWFGVVVNGQIFSDRNDYTVTADGEVNDLALLPGGEAVANVYVQVPNEVPLAGLIFAVNPGYPDYWTFFALQ